jgi:Lipocalin-like domain
MTFEFNLKGNGRGAIAALAAATLLSSGATVNAAPKGNPSLAGTWTLVAADKESPDGARSHDQYGEHPKGRLIIDAKGRYSVEIFRPELPNFAANESEPTPGEYRDAMEAASVHYGQITIDWANHTLRMAIDEALYPNLRGAVQLRPFEYDGKVLSYRLPRNAEGIVRISVWRREK